MRNYNNNLNIVMTDRNKTGLKVMTHRKYQKASEDPASANSAARLHHQYLSNLDNIETVKDLQSRLDVSLGALTSVNEQAQTILSDATLSALNGTSTAEQRKTYAATLRSAQEAMIQFTNVTYGDKYLLSGKDTDKPPFEMDNGVLKYLGIDVTDSAQLDAKVDEKSYVDIGLGISGNTFNDATAYNTAISAIGVLGYGTVTVDGTAINKNLIALTGQMADLLENSTDADWSTTGFNQFNAMRNQYQESYNTAVDAQATLGIQSNYLDTTLERYKDMDVSFQEQITDVEYVDDAAAISEYMYTQYAYNAALRVGNSILSSTLLDFLS